MILLCLLQKKMIDRLRLVLCLGSDVYGSKKWHHFNVYSWITQLNMKVSGERDNKVWKILTEAAYQGTYLWAVHCIVIDGRDLSTGLFIIVRESRVFGFIVTYALLHYTALGKLQLLFYAVAQYMCEWTLTLENGLDSNRHKPIMIVYCRIWQSICHCQSMCSRRHQSRYSTVIPLRRMDLSLGAFITFLW